MPNPADLYVRAFAARAANAAHTRYDAGDQPITAGVRAVLFAANSGEIADDVVEGQCRARLLAADLTVAPIAGDKLTLFNKVYKITGVDDASCRAQGQLLAYIVDLAG
jgi:hypothetical protein